MTTPETIAAALLQAGAVHLQPDNPFTFASGLRSPIYCDNRLLIGDVAARRVVIPAFAETCADAAVVAGTATAGIPWAAWVAEALALPMAYVRGSAKGHGRGRQIEGAAVAGQRVMLLEDTISTGESALAARMVRAGIDRIEPRPLRREDRRDRLLNRRKLAPAEIAAADARLIGHEHHGNATPVGRSDDVGGAGQNGDVINAAEIIGLPHHDAVAIEKQSRSAAGGAVAHLAPHALGVDGIAHGVQAPCPTKRLSGKQIIRARPKP